MPSCLGAASAMSPSSQSPSASRSWPTWFAAPWKGSSRANISVALSGLGCMSPPGSKTRHSMNILYIGGTGQISLPCVEQSLAAGHKVAVYNRGQRGEPLPAGVELIQGDMNDAAAYGALGKR